MFRNNIHLLHKQPQARAWIQGSSKYPQIRGTVNLYQTNSGVLIAAEVWGLPKESSFLGFHVHESGHCDGDTGDPLSHVGAHYNPDHTEHPHHAGDLPPLMNNGGRALSIFMTDRFTVHEVIGRAFIIHASPDDFITQPSGNSGEKIACGIILYNKNNCSK